MAKQLMIYERAVPVSVEAHKGWSVKSEGTFGFAKDANSVPVLAAEFAPAELAGNPIIEGEVLANCRIELVHLVKEQAMTETVHRYGNIV